MLHGLRSYNACVCLLLIVAVLTAVGQVSTVLGSACQLRETEVDYPSTVQPDQTFVVAANLTVTCSTINNNVIARVDVVNLQTGKIITSSSYGVGVIQVSTAPYLKTFNVTVTNTLQAPVKNEVWNLQLNIWIFADVYVQASATKTIQVQVGAPSQIISTTSSISVSSTNVTNAQTVSVQSETPINTNGGQSSSSINYVPLAGGAVLVAVASIASVVMLSKRRKLQTGTAGVVVASAASSGAVPVTEPTSDSENILPTGYPELDSLLRGGLPTGRTILVISGPWDEKELLFNKIIESALTHGDTVYFLTRDLGRSQDLAHKHPQHFYVLTPRADKIPGQPANISKISDVSSLNDVNISLSKAMETISDTTKGKLMVIDFLSDILLEHGGVTTRKWLDEFITRRKSEGVMVIASLNPLIVREQESQQVIDVFDGVLEIFEITGRPRRFLIIRKMSGRKYIETELSLNKDKLY